MTTKRKSNANEPPSTPGGEQSYTMSTLETPATPRIDSDDSLSAMTSAQKRVKFEASETKQKPSSKAPTIDAVYNRIIHIQVGQCEKNFGIHEGLLRKCSPLLNSILDSSEEDLKICLYNPKASLLILLEEDESTYVRAQRWLYSDSLLMDEEPYSALAWSTLLNIYLFAIKFRMVRLQNKCIDTAILKNRADNKLPNAETLIRLWKPETGAAPMRSLLLQLYARKCDLKSAMNMPGSGRFPMQFLRALICELYAVVEGKEEGETGKVKFWARRKDWYVNDERNPIAVDD